MIKTLAIGCDHAGVALKNEIIMHLEQKGISVTDVGTYTEESVDYPVYANKVCDLITEKKSELGILVCGTGIGMSMAANKRKGIRAAVCENTFSARLTRIHNDANVLCLGARVTGIGLALDMVDLFVDTDFEGGKHERRINMYEPRA